MFMHTGSCEPHVFLLASMCVVGKAKKLRTQKHVRPCLRLGCVAMLTPCSQNPRQDTRVFSDHERGDAVGTED